MHYRVAIVYVLPDKLEAAKEFQRAARERLKGFKSQFHQILQDHDEPLRFVHILGFQSEQELDEYLKSPELAAVLADTAGVGAWRDPDTALFEARLHDI